MERRGNYFMPNNGQIGFSPLHMLGLSAIHPKSMQHGFVDVSVNTHTADNNFSLFKCKGQDSEIANMRNNLMDTFGCGFPVGNSFSKFIGGFIGSKCLIGSSTGRENNFWGRVLQQYNNIIGANNNIYISMSAVNTKENAGEYMKAGIVDAALLFSQNFDLFSTNNLISQDQTMGTKTKVSPQESSSSSMEMHLQGGVTAEPKQSYAEVTKSRVARKSPCTAASDRSSMCSKRLRSVRRYPRKQGQKEHSIHISPNNNWKYRTHRDDSAKHMENTNYIREHRRKRCSVSRDNHQKTVASANSLKDTGTPNTSEDQKMNDLRTNNVQHSASRPNKKMPGKRKLNSNLLSDIKEDCLDVYDYLMACEKKGPFNDKLSHPPTKKWTPPTDQRSPSNYCANWRCRPYSLCDPCKIKESYGNGVTDGDGSYTRQKTVTFETEQRENVKENNVPETPVIPLSLEKADDSSAKPISCSGSSLAECERFVSTMCPVTRRRISSECSVDSEDSFVIVFEASGDDPHEETSSETESVCSDSDSSDDDDTSSINIQCLTYKEHSDHHDDCNFDYDDDDDDEIDFDDDDDDNDDDDEDPYISKAELEEANARWESAYEDTQSAEKEPEKIHFDDNYYCYENDDDYDGGGGGGGGDDDVGDGDDAEIKVVSYISKSELEEANARWESAYEDTQSAEKEPEKVQFAESPKLTTVHKIIAWDFAYRAARLGPWGAMALDRSRFHRRIQHMNRILSPVLQDQHRRKIWQKFHNETLNVP